MDSRQNPPKRSIGYRANMGIVTNPIMQRTYALRFSETAEATAQQLHGTRRRAEVQGLVELVYASLSARAAVAAIRSLEASDSPIIIDCLLHAVFNRSISVRHVAVEDLARRSSSRGVPAAERVLQADPSWQVRQAALRYLAGSTGESRWHVLMACDDPHWRVRHALAEVLLEWGSNSNERERILRRLTIRGPDRLTGGLVSWLKYRWGDPEEAQADLEPSGLPVRRPDFWNADAAVLARNLRQLGKRGRKNAVDDMPALAGHDDQRVRKLALDCLRSQAAPCLLAEALVIVDDPCRPAAHDVTEMLAQLDDDCEEDVARAVFSKSGPSPAQLAWAIDQVGEVFPWEESPPTLVRYIENFCDQLQPVRTALVRLAGRVNERPTRELLRRAIADKDPEVTVELLPLLESSEDVAVSAVSWTEWLHSSHPRVRAASVEPALTRGYCGDADLNALSNDPDVRVRLQLCKCLIRRESTEFHRVVSRLADDEHPHVRAAALTRERAEQLVDTPDEEVSWHVLAAAAQMAKVPLWHLEPAGERGGPAQQQQATIHLSDPRIATETTDALDEALVCRLGDQGPLVSRVGLSGHYRLPEEGFERAMRAGVNLMFWESSYQTMTNFVTRLRRRDRACLHFVTGTFEAEEIRIRRDAERTLRNLGIERLDVFLLFWVRSWDRVTDEVWQTLQQLKQEGKIARLGLSTHSRTLARQALQSSDWDVLMVRHSAAHRGAENEIFPAAVAAGKPLITFNNTCYGRLLSAAAESGSVEPADCYRYCLAQPGVTACWTAPATVTELKDNLKALRDPQLPPDRRQSLCQIGDTVYRDDTVFRHLIRSR